MLSSSVLVAACFSLLPLVLADSVNPPTASSASSESGSATCYFPDGSVAQQLVPCNSDASVSSCCPSTNSGNLYYPLSYQVCEPSGLCKAGNSPFLARGGCTSRSWDDPACPQVGRAVNASGMAGTTSCGASGPWLCMDADKDAGRCDCSPPSGSAFKFDGSDNKPIFFADQGSGTGATTTVTRWATDSVTVVPSSAAAAATTSTATNSSAAGPSISLVTATTAGTQGSVGGQSASTTAPASTTSSAVATGGAGSGHVPRAEMAVGVILGLLAYM